MRLTLATLALLATLGCGGGGGSSDAPTTNNNLPKFNVTFKVSPKNPLVNQPVDFFIDEKNKKPIRVIIDLDAETDSNNDGNTGNDPDLAGNNSSSYKDSKAFSQPGVYNLILYYRDPAGGPISNIKETIIVRPNDFFTDVQEAIPAGFFYVKKLDYDKLIKPHIDLLDQTFINDLEKTIIAGLTNGDFIDGFGFKSNGLVVGVNSPNSRFKNDDKDSEKEYAGSLDARLVDLSAVKNIYDFLTAKALDNDVIRIASRLYPNGSTITRNSTMTLLNYGDVFCNNILTYTLNGNQINIGLVLDTTTSPLIQQDKDVIAAFNKDYKDKNIYIPISVIVLKDGSLYDAVKAMTVELKYHQDNN